LVSTSWFARSVWPSGWKPEVDHHLQQLKQACSTLQQINKSLKTKVADLEGRSSHQNICIISLSEAIEGSRQAAFFSQLLLNVFGMETLV